MGLHGIPMGNMSNQQLMQMQLHGMDLQRVGMGLPGLLLCAACVAATPEHFGLLCAISSCCSKILTTMDVTSRVYFQGSVAIPPVAGANNMVPGANSPGMHLGMGMAAGAAACVTAGMQQVYLYTCRPPVVKHIVYFVLE